MVKLEERHVSGESFTYTVMNLEQTECLGCVYVVSPEASWFSDAHVTAVGADQWSDCDAMIYLWIRSGWDRKDQRRSGSHVPQRCLLSRRRCRRRPVAQLWPAGGHDGGADDQRQRIPGIRNRFEETRSSIGSDQFDTHPRSRRCPLVGEFRHHATRCESRELGERQELSYPP